MTPRLGTAVLISARGANLQAIIGAIAGGSLPVELGEDAPEVDLE